MGVLPINAYLERDHLGILILKLVNSAIQTDPQSALRFKIRKAQTSILYLLLEFSF